MSLINQASLILTPNAVKESKLYSIVPSNGNGDMTVVRATTATRVNSEGLIEPSPYNLIGYSNSFNNSIWTKTGPSITPNTTISPDGNQNASTITFTGLDQLITQGAIPIGSNVTFSIWLKGVAGEKISINCGNVNSLLTLTSDWTRFVINNPNSSNAFLGINTYNTSANARVLQMYGAQLVQGSVAKDYFYTTDRLNVPRLNYDVAGGCPSILLEPQRTNLVLRSEEFENAYWQKFGSSIGVNSAISPTGALNSDKIIEDTSSLAHRIISTQIPTTTGVSYTCSIFIKPAGRNFAFVRLNNSGGDIASGNIDLISGAVTQVSSGTITTISYTNGWYRVIFSGTSASTSDAFFEVRTSNSSTYANFAGDGVSGISVFGAQLEVGAYATSYIPTVASTVTRNTDVTTRNNIYTNGYITSAGGTWVVELNNNFSLTRDAIGSGIWIGDNNSSSTSGNSLNIRHNGFTSRLIINKNIAGVLTALYVTLTDTVKLAINWNGTTADLFVNGVKVITGTSFTTTNMEFLNSSTSDVPRYIKSMMLFPKSLTDAEMILLTSYYFDTYSNMAKYLNYTIQ